MVFEKDNSVTNAKVVWPFYGYAAIVFLCACVLLTYHSNVLSGHYFQPQLLAITHAMSIGWATMVIFGATFQLLPVISGEKLFSEKTAQWSFYLAAISIPFLIVGFYYFVFNHLFFCAALIFITAVVLFLWNVYKTVMSSDNIHGDFILSASIYLFFTVILGFILALNFSHNILPESSLSYLKLHAHLGIIGWFLFLIIGVGSKLLPMFFISKYQNAPLLKVIYYCLHLFIILFIVSQTFIKIELLLYLSIIGFISIAIIFVYYIFQSFKNRIKKKVDITMKATLISMVCIFGILSLIPKSNLAVGYGFVIFFGWISLLILGMTFKTLPFIIWNERYINYSGKTPNPKDLYSEKLFRWMLIIYVVGFLVTLIGILLNNILLLKYSTILLLIASILYTINVFIVLTHKTNVS